MRVGLDNGEHLFAGRFRKYFESGALILRAVRSRRGPFRIEIKKRRHASMVSRKGAGDGVMPFSRL